MVGCWIGVEVFERDCARADGRFVRALAAGCGLLVVEWVLVDEMAECGIVAKVETGVGLRADWMAVKMAVERAGKLAVN